MADALSRLSLLHFTLNGSTPPLLWPLIRSSPRSPNLSFKPCSISTRHLDRFSRLKMREIPDKSWIDIPRMERRRGDTRYRDGWEAFLQYADTNPRKLENGLLYCPCCKCRNTGLVDVIVVRNHLEIWGFDENYKYWNFHGEDSIEDIEPDENTGVKKKCEKAKDNQKAKKYNHFLGTTSFAGVEEKYLRENPDVLTTPQTLLARAAYTPPEGYDQSNNELEVNNMNAALEVTQDEVLDQALQSQGIGDTHLVPNCMTREQRRQVIDGDFGPKPFKKGRVSLSSAEVSSYASARSMASESTVTSQRQIEGSYVIAEIGVFIIDHLECKMAYNILPILMSELRDEPTAWDVAQRVVASTTLREILPKDIYTTISLMAFAAVQRSNVGFGSGEARRGTPVGSSSTIRCPDVVATNLEEDDDDE